MGELQLALRTASSSNDSDLMMMVALSLYDKSLIIKTVMDRSEEGVPEQLLGLLRHFPRVFESWLLYVSELDANRVLQVRNFLGEIDEVASLLIEDALKEIDVNKRRDALKKTLGMVSNAVSAGRKEMLFTQTVETWKRGEG